MRIKITWEDIKASQAPNRTVFGDGSMRSLFLYVTTTGAKSWIAVCQVKAKLARTCLGKWPELRFKVVRRRAERANGDIVRGINSRIAKWVERSAIRFSKLFLEQPKIIFPDTAVSCRYALHRQGLFGDNTTNFLPTVDSYLLGLLHSRTAQFYFQQACATLEGSGESYLRFFGQYMQRFPIPICQTKTDCQKQQVIESNVQSAIVLQL